MVVVVWCEGVILPFLGREAAGLYFKGERGLGAEKECIEMGGLSWPVGFLVQVGR